MKHQLVHRAPRALAAGFAIAALSAAALATDIPVKLSGDQEVPPVKSPGAGSGMFAVSADNTIAGSVSTTGLAGTSAHIHEGAPGKNGPVIIPLTKGANDTYTVPAGTKLSENQVTALKAGNLYVNVHTAANQGGEVRAQLKP